MKNIIEEKEKSSPVILNLVQNPESDKRSRNKFGIQWKKVIRNKEKGIQKIRFIVQTLFALLCIWIGVEFYQFLQYLETNGSAAFTSRPPGVDGFLPISSFMSFYLFLMTGEVHSAHPAGFFIFFAIVLVSIVFGKAFCSWLMSGWIFIRTDW
ncbi:MAG: 4Fe-4S binding protein [Ignavibacteriaceae bacterium]|nr:4Fe-4S binding protein [Ignavibacteriaceae bacterium]